MALVTTNNVDTTLDESAGLQNFIYMQEATSAR